MANNLGKPHQRTIDRARIGVRLELRNMGWPISDIAAHLGMSPTAYSLLRRTKLFRVLKQQYISGVLSIYDEGLAEDLDALKKMLRNARPMAIENLVAFASDRTNNPRLAFEATKEILNRDGHFAAVTRIGLPTVEQGGVGTKEDDKVAGELLSALANVKKKSIDSNPDTNTVQ